MTRQIVILFVTLNLIACHNGVENQLTEIEKHIMRSDSVMVNSRLFDQMVNQILAKRPEFEVDTAKVIEAKARGQLKERILKFYYDTTGNYTFINYRIVVKEYQSDRHAAEDFWRIIEFNACCIPDEDIVKLKNFENLSHFKNSASTTLLTDNIIVTLDLGSETEMNSEISDLFDSLLKEREYLKLEIGNGGPAIWTRK